MSIRRAVAAPCFADDPADLVRLAVEAEEAGFDGFFLWDHITWANDGLGPSIVDPWAVLSVIAARTKRLVIGPMITPVPRRRPWVLARQTVTLDLLAGGRPYSASAWARPLTATSACSATRPTIGRGRRCSTRDST